MTVALPYSGGRHADPIPGAPALEVRDLRASHPGMEFPALDGVSLRIPPGTRVALVGPNGSGMCHLHHPHDGHCDDHGPVEVAG